MGRISLVNIYNHPIGQKYLSRSGIAHAISVSYNAFRLAKKYDVNPDLAAKAGLLHDIGHYTWYTEGKWDYDKYKKNDIHPIKGAERAHKLLVRLGEEPYAAKLISLAILFHTDSYFPDEGLYLTHLQKIITMADEADKEKNDQHHYRKINQEHVEYLLSKLDIKIEKELANMSKKIPIIEGL